MKKVALFLIILLSGLASASVADLPRIAVYVTGDVGENEKSALGTRMLASLVNSGRYRGIERSSAFLAEIDREQTKQRSGAIDDGQISELGKQFGVKYVCIAAITPAFGSFQVSARIVDVETAEVAFIGEAHSPLSSMKDMAHVADEVVRIMFSGKQAKPQGAVQPVLAAPKPLMRPASWAAIGLDVLGVGLFAYAFYEDGNVTGHSSRAAAEKSYRNRNLAYAVGTAVLLSGISVHIFF